MPDAPRGGDASNDKELERRARNPLARDIREGHAAVSYLELFFDLVFVFAITQLSHLLLNDLTPAGALRAAILFFAVWWAWIYTAWVTNWLDPDHALNRIALGLVMLASLMMGAAIPDAFGGGGVAFVATYLAVQIGRSLYASFALGEWRGSHSTNSLRIAIWFMASAIPWILGLTRDEPAWRAAWWMVALAIEYAGPYAMFRVPLLGRSTPRDWLIAGDHMAERCALFIIIALGEGLLITGATFAAAPATPGLNAAFLLAVLGSFALWWLYFDVGARRGAEHIEHHRNPEQVARLAFTYWHIPIVAGIIVLAVADELTLLHPYDPSHADFVLVVTGGLTLFIGGNMVFKRIVGGNPWFPLSHGIGLALTLAVGGWGFAAHPSHLALAEVATAVLVAVALWEWGSFHGGWLERMEARGWWISRVLRRRMDRRNARRKARAEARG